MKLTPSARRAWKWSAAALVIGALAWLAWLLAQPVPTWQGKTAGAWIAECRAGDEKLAHAILALDEAALPALRRAAQARDSAFTRFKQKHWAKLPQFLRDRLIPPASAERLRENAAHGFRLLGPAARHDAPLLARLTRDKEPMVRQAAAFALGDIGATDPEIITCLVTNLAGSLTNRGRPDPSFPWMQQACAHSLGRLRADRPDVVRVLLLAVTTGEDGTRGNAAHALGRIQSADTNVVPTLLRVFKNDPSAVRVMADALGAYGPAASNAAPALTERLQLCLSADQSFLPRAVPSFARKSPEVGRDIMTASASVAALGHIGPAAAPAVPDLKKAMQDNRLVVPAALALWKITRDPGESLPVLLKRASGGMPGLPADLSALDAVGVMGADGLSALPDALSALPVLASARSLGDRFVSLSAAVALWRVAPDGVAPPLAALTNALLITTNDVPPKAAAGAAAWGGSDYRRAYAQGLHYQAAKLLRALGPAARDAVPALKAARRTPDLMLRQLIDDALRDIEQAEPQLNRP